MAYRFYKRKKASPPPKYSLSEWLGRYEAYLLNMYGRRTFRYHVPKLELFFDFFNNNWSLEKFTAVEVIDYIRWRQRNRVSDKSIAFELTSVRKFWAWLIDDKGLNLLNPVSRRHNKKFTDALISEAKSNRSGFTEVEISPTDEGSPIYYDDLYDVLV